MADLLIPLAGDLEEIARRISTYLQTYKEVDIRVFTEKELGVFQPDFEVVDRVANEFRKEKRFSIVQAEIGSATTYYISRQSWAERHPTLDKFA